MTAATSRPRKAWLSIQGRRCWFNINWTPNPYDFLFPTVSAHAELGQWWIGNSKSAVDLLRRQLRDDYQAEVFELDIGCWLPSLHFLELMSSQHPLEQALFQLMMATPTERHRRMIKHLAATAHPDGVTGSRPRRSRSPGGLLLAAQRDRPGVSHASIGGYRRPALRVHRPADTRL